MPVNSRLKSKSVDEFFKAILALKTNEECYRFFEDVCTVKEIQELALRWAVARKLVTGATYQEVVKDTGASTATVARVKKYLDYGADGYKLVLKRQGLLKK